jgi:hypothetical protein
VRSTTRSGSFSGKHLRPTYLRCNYLYLKDM